jgi:uncharacterized protein YfaS (alpha-2-macroglobulin family)
MRKWFYILTGIGTLCLTACVSRHQAIIKKEMNPYTTEWAAIESLRRQGLPASLFPKVDSIYRSAYAEGNYEQMIKALIVRMNSMGLLGAGAESDAASSGGHETAANQIFSRLKADAQQVPPPARSILYSMIGQLYGDFYTQNSRTINLRTPGAASPDDVYTWDARRLSEEALAYYDRSLRDAARLQQEPVDGYREILLPGYEPTFQPTLYDLLANRALAFYASSFQHHALPQQTFVADDPAFFADAPAFVRQTIRTTDTLSPACLSLKTYQELLRFHLERSRFPVVSGKTGQDAAAALIEVDLRRMDYLKEHGRYADPEAHYEKALAAMRKAYKAYDANAAVWLRSGGFYLERGAQWRHDRQDALRNGYAQAWEACERMTQDHPGQLTPQAEALKERILYHELELRVEATQLPDRPFLALLQYRNIDTLYQTVYRLTEEQALDYTDRLGGFRTDRSGGLSDFIRTLRVEPSRRQLKLPTPTPDFQYYTTEIALGPLEKGFYLAFVSDTEDPATALADSSSASCAALVQVSSLAAQNRRLDRTMTVLVTDRVGGKGIAGAKVSLYRSTRGGGRPELLTSFTADADGVARSREKLDQHVSLPYYRVEAGADRLLVFGNSYNRELYPSRTGDHRGLLFTDRSVYRPGQTVFFKAILYDRVADEPTTALRGATAVVCLRDANGQTVAEQRLTSNDFGSIDGSFTIPQGLLNGVMTLECKEYASETIRVEEYRRPTFEVTFDPVTDAPALNAPVRVTAHARALAGYALDRAAVRYRVVRTTRRAYHAGPYPVATDRREIASGRVETDEKGAFAVAFTAWADDTPADNRVYTYTVTAEVTDLNGETQHAALQVNTARRPLLIRTNLPEAIRSDRPHNYTAEATNLNGEPVPASVRVEIVALNSPDRILRRRLWQETVDVRTIPEEAFRRDFPLDAYADEMNPECMEVAGMVADYTLATPTKTTLDLSTLQRSGYYRICFTADDGKGLPAERTQYVYLHASEPEPITDPDHWLTTVKDEGEPGDTVEFRVAGGRAESYVYGEWIHKDRVVEARWIRTGPTPTRLTFPLKEEHRGGLGLQLTMVQDNRVYKAFRQITTPYTNKMLDVKLATLRDRLLPGEQETWTLSVVDRQGSRPAMAEVVASLYDASLEAIQPHEWPDFRSLYRQYVNTYAYEWSTSSLQQFSWNGAPPVRRRPAAWQRLVFLTDLNWLDATYLEAFYTHAGGRYGQPLLLRSMEMNSMAAVEPDEAKSLRRKSYGSAAQEEEEHADFRISKGFASADAPDAGEDAGLTDVATRTNFNETAFFYPHLRTNEHGEVLLTFTMPEALTRWKLLSFAHTRDLKAGVCTAELLTQKQVAVSVYAPRFLREQDVIELTAKVNNLTADPLDGEALLRLYDAATMQPLDNVMILSERSVPFRVEAGRSAGLRWKLAIPADGGLQAIVYKVTAQAGAHTDGEERTIPTLTQSMLVTETLPFTVRAGQEKTVTMEKLTGRSSKTLRPHRLTLEFTSAPAWYAVQALPYLMEYPYECSEQIFARYYANSLATAVVRQTPRIRQIFALWNVPGGGDALLSALEKNRELKQVMLEESPWVMQARNESEQRQRIGLLFDLNRMSHELDRAFAQLEKAQNADGGFPWFEGDRSDRYITQYIVSGMARLKRLHAMREENAPGVATMIRKGLAYLDAEIRQDYETLLRRKAEPDRRQITPLQLHYLYACSFEGHRPAEEATAFEYYLTQAATFWQEFSTCEKALAALALHRNGRSEKALEIVRSLKEYAQRSEELGMFWRDNVPGYFWYQAPVETQATLMEAFHEVARDDEAVEEMKIHLLREKQTNAWKTTKATSEAVYALLMTGAELLNESALLEVEIGGQPLAQMATEAIRPEAGTGYVKTSWQGDRVTPAMGRLRVRNPNGRGVAWGGLYWQYFERMDRITPSGETTLKLRKQLFRRVATAKGEELQPVDASCQLRVGDRLCVRMELRADRSYEYVHLKDLRAAGFEPVSVRSGHRFRDGLWYYESVKDASTNFFISSLPAGTYVFEYDLRVSHAGNFSNGIATFQCVYAPEFSAHSEGLRVRVDGP